MSLRVEKDFLGELEIASDALYGIHSYRASKNFPQSEETHDLYFIRAYLWLKKACVRAAQEVNLLDSHKRESIERAIDFLLDHMEVVQKNLIVSVKQGGAGTSLNMNLNEIIANQALLLIGENPGNYHLIHPNEDVNICQSTNDTYPTALRIAIIIRLRELTEEVCRLQEALQKKEQEFASVVKIGRTECQDAVPMTLGSEFGAYAEAISRDRWRLYKAEERLRVVNLGGTAIGTSINAPRRYIFLALEYLRSLSGVGISKAENLVDATSNQDLLLEAYGFVKLLAVNIYKIAQDLRYLSSNPVGEIHLPQLQAGSSIMPGKINPVVPELVIQTAFDIISTEQGITQAVMNANLELNPYFPYISNQYLRSIEYLTQTIKIFHEKCILGITADKEKCYQNLLSSYSILTILNPKFGYEKVSELIREAIEKGKNVAQLIQEKQWLTEDDIRNMASQK